MSRVVCKIAVTLSKVFLERVGDRVRGRTLNTEISRVCRPGERRLIFKLEAFSNGGGLLLSTQTGSPEIGFYSSAPRGPTRPPVFYVLLQGEVNNKGLIKLHRGNYSHILVLSFRYIGRLNSAIVVAIMYRVVNVCDGVVVISSGNIVVSSLEHMSLAVDDGELMLPGVGCRLPRSRGGLGLLGYSILSIYATMGGLSARVPLGGTLLEAVRNISPVMYHRVRCGIVRNTAGEVRNILFSQLTIRVRGLGDIYDSYSNGPIIICHRSNGPVSFYFVGIRRCNSFTGIRDGRDFSSLLSKFCRTHSDHSEVEIGSRDLAGLLGGALRELTQGVTGRGDRLRHYTSHRRLHVYNSLLRTGVCHVRHNTRCISIRGFCSRGGTVLHVGLGPTVSPSTGTRGCCGSCHGTGGTRVVLGRRLRGNERRLSCVGSILSAISHTRGRGSLTRVHRRLARRNCLGIRGNGGPHRAALPPLRFRSDSNFGVLMKEGGHRGSGLALGATSGGSV